MARADSTVKVNIIGDSKGLQRELGKADKGIAGLGVSVKGLVAGAAFAGAAVAVTDFAQSALNESDRVGDAVTRLDLQIGDLSDQLVDASDDFAKLGQSQGDILELAAAFADTATALQLADPLIASFADDAAATAAAIALLGDQSADEVIDLIGKAAGGGAKALKALGISLTDAEVESRALADTGKLTAESLTDADLAAASYALVLEKLKPRLDAVAEGSGDVEQRQAEVEARFETLTGKIGAALEGPLNDLLGWILSGIDGWELFANRMDLVEQAARDMLGPLARVADALRTINDLIRTGGGLLPNAGAIGIDDLERLRNSPTGSGGGGGAQKPNVTIQVQPNGAADTERAVINALRDYNRRNGIL